MKYCISTFFSLILFVSITNGQDWVQQLGSSNIDQAHEIAVDAVGNSYVTGFFSQTINIGGSNVISSAGGRDIFIAKYNPTGILDWAIGVGGSGNDEGKDIAVDNNGNIYIVGEFAASVDFDPTIGLAIQTATGATDVFWAKYNPDGTFVSVDKIDGSGAELASTLELDNQGNIFLSGTFDETLDFTNLSTADNLTSTLNSSVFFAKYNATGSFAWSNKIESPSAIQINDMAQDDGRIYIAGYYKDTTDFNPNPNIEFRLNPAGNNDAFLAKYNTNGAMMWAKSMQGIDNEAAEAIHVNIEGNILVTGFFLNSIDLDPSIAHTHFVSSQGQRDVFFAQYSPSGALRWGKRFGGNDNDYGYTIATDNQRRIFIGGSFQGTCDANPDNTQAAFMTSVGNEDMYFARYDSLGNFEWAGTAGGSNGDLVQSLAVNNVLEVYCTGWFQGTSQFFGTTNLQSNGDRDIYVAKVNTNIPSVNTAFIHPARQILIYPNPVEDILKIELEYGVLENATISLTDAIGRTAFHQIINNDFQSGMTLLNIPSTVPRGFYFVNIFENDRLVYTEKVLLK